MVTLSYCPINLNLKNGQWHSRLVRRTRTCATPLKTVCIDIFPRLKKIPSDVHSCLCCTITSRGRDDRFTCHLNWGATAICHITLKSHKRVFIVSNFYKMKKNVIQRHNFIPKVTCSVLYVGTLSVFSLLSDVFFTWEHDLTTMACKM